MSACERRSVDDDVVPALSARLTAERQIVQRGSAMAGAVKSGEIEQRVAAAVRTGGGDVACGAWLLATTPGEVRRERSDGSSSAVMEPALSNLDALINAAPALNAVDQPVLARDPAGTPAGQGACQCLGLAYADMRGAARCLD